MIVDFGFAEPYPAPNWQPRQTIYGSEGYLTPEVAFEGSARTNWRDQVTPALDVFAWGCLLGELFRGGRVFAPTENESWRSSLRSWSCSAELRARSVARWTARNLELSQRWCESMSSMACTASEAPDVCNASKALLLALQPQPQSRLCFKCADAWPA
jgi:serine/threonine protein kinase